MIDFELYKIFKLIADDENLTKTSTKLFISQPALSKHIKNLEQELNTELFIRNKYGMFLTENGKKLYEYIKDPIEALLKAESIFEDKKTIKLGVHVNMPEKVFSGIISEYYVKNTNTIINIEKYVAEELFLKLQNQKIDLVISKQYNDLYDDNKIKFIEMGNFNDEFIVRADSKYLKRKITLEELKTIPIYTLQKFSETYKNLTSLLKNENLVENITYSSMLNLLKTRDVITVFTKEYAEDMIKNNELAILDLDVNLPKEKYGIFYNVKNKSNEIMKFINLVKENHKYN